MLVTLRSFNLSKTASSLQKLDVYFLLKVHVKRSLKGKDSTLSSDIGGNSHLVKTLKPPIVRKGKLVVVDLAGSERIDKSGVYMQL